jgi:uncharacterized protein (TIGR02246 family)
MNIFPRVLVVLFASALAVGPVHAESDGEAIERLETQWNQAHLAGNTDTLRELWADDLTILVPRMDPMSKEEALAFWARVPVKFTRYESSMLTTQLLGETAVTTGRVVRARNFGGKAMEDTWLFTKVYVKQSGVWRVIAYHASEAPAPEPQP